MRPSLRAGLSKHNMILAHCSILGLWPKVPTCTNCRAKRHLFRVVLFIAVGAEPSTGLHLLSHTLQLPSIPNQQASPAEAPTC